MSGGVVVLCPMAVERAAVEKAVKAAGCAAVRVLQTGIGAAAIVRTVDDLATRPERPSAIILAGLCGGLAEGPDVPPLARVIDEHGHAWTAFLGSATGGATLIGVDRIIDTPAAKRVLSARTGATVVDMESHAFAERCQRRAVRWGIVRGVSDNPSEELPAEILNWITASGDTLVLRAMWDMAKRPSHIPHILRFARRSKRVLPAVGKRVVELIALAKTAEGAITS